MAILRITTIEGNRNPGSIKNRESLIRPKTKYATIVQWLVRLSRKE